MIERVQFRIDGRPQPWKRAGRARNGRSFDSNADAKNEIATVARINWPGVPTDCAVAISLWFCFERPKSHVCKSGLRSTAPREHVQKPDIDNLAKLVLDALEGVIYLNDSQIYSMDAAKQWRSSDPHTVIALQILRGRGEDRRGLQNAALGVPA